MSGMRPWEEKLTQQLRHTVDADPQENVDQLMSMLNNSDRLSKSTVMFSEVTYSDEFEHERLNLTSNRTYTALFFEITTFDNKIRYRSALSEEELFAKYKNIKCARSIKQQEYAKLREHAVHISEDDLE